MSALAVLAALLPMLVAPGARAGAEELLVGVTVSAHEAVEEIGERFAEDRAGLRLRYHAAGAEELRRQVEDGPPPDVVVLASQRSLDELARADLLVPGARRVFAGNVLVALRPAASSLDVPGPSDLLDRRVRRVAVGGPRTDVGQYTEESLRKLGVWARLQPKLVLGDDSHAVLALVVGGDVDVGIVYATDGVQELPRVRLAFAIPVETHRPIAYTAAVVKGARLPEVARAFVEFLASPDAQRILGRYGFERAPAGPR